MTLDVKELRRLAERAALEAPGAWSHRTGARYLSWVILDSGKRLHATCENVHADDVPAFIAAANPSTVLALLDQLAAVSKARDTLAEIAECATHVIDNAMCEKRRALIDNIPVEDVDKLRKVGR